MLPCQSLWEAHEYNNKVWWRWRVSNPRTKHSICWFMFSLTFSPPKIKWKRRGELNSYGWLMKPLSYQYFTSLCNIKWWVPRDSNSATARTNTTIWYAGQIYSLVPLDTPKFVLIKWLGWRDSNSHSPDWRSGAIALFLPHPLALRFLIFEKMERATGIEPAFNLSKLAWRARAQPLYHTRIKI